MICIYRAEDGKISRYLSAPDSDIAMNVLETEQYIECEGLLNATHIIDNEPVIIAPAQPPDEELLSRIRYQRDNRLLSCDWTQTLDAPIISEQRIRWAAYRQSLRDFPGKCNLAGPIWPTEPLA